MNRSAIACLTVIMCAPLPAGASEEPLTIATAQHSFALTRVAGPLEHPWGLDWLPDGRILVSERPGRLRIVDKDGIVSAPIKGLPEISSEFRDGLLDVSVDPDFAENKTVYFAYSGFENGKRWQIVSSATLEGSELKAVKPIFQSKVKVEKDQGFGARIRFASDKSMFITVGDHAAAAQAQDPSNALGSVIRLTRNGSAVATNPFTADNTKLNSIFAYGFKNPQGLAVHPETGAVWLADHGARGGGEINVVKAAGNYGWPTRTFGTRNDEPGASQVDGAGFIDPVFTWGAAPTVALSGLSFYSGNDFPAWKNDLFVGSLSTDALIRLMLDTGGRVIGTEHVIDGEIGRIRDVRQGPDGKLYVLNDDEEGAIYRLDPVK